MSGQSQLELYRGLNFVENEADWTFNGASTRDLTHCYHDYPARMIPQVAAKLLDMFGKEATLLFDPYCGTGTSLVEALTRGIHAVGTDLNPLACLIARAKTSTLNVKLLSQEIAKFQTFVLKKPKASSMPDIQGIARLDFWFKPAVIEKLYCLREFIDKIQNKNIRLFFQVAFSETVRECSNTRNEEFKLYRYELEKLKTFSPDVFGIMMLKLKRNQKGLEQFYTLIEKFKPRPFAKIYEFNTVLDIPSVKLAKESVDIVVTSPPYGDSHTTVAYGQYSRLSAAWLGLQDGHSIDARLMGGKVNKDLSACGYAQAEIADLHCDSLACAVSLIREKDLKRALEVSAFYMDLWKSICHVAKSIRLSGYACYVVGNRKVKGVVLPTDDAIRCFFEILGFNHVATFHRSIPNKRMPLRNSPTNVHGVSDNTMHQEYIVVMQRVD